MVVDGGIRVVEALSVQLNSCRSVSCWVRISGGLTSYFASIQYFPVRTHYTLLQFLSLKPDLN